MNHYIIHNCLESLNNNQQLLLSGMSGRSLPIQVFTPWGLCGLEKVVEMEKKHQDK